MKYYWTECPGCRCQVAINFAVRDEKISGSVRRWSYDRSVNDGRRFEVPEGSLDADGSFATPCVCGQELRVPATPSATGEEREPGLRVDLHTP